MNEDVMKQSAAADVLNDKRVRSVCDSRVSLVRSANDVCLIMSQCCSRVGGCCSVRQVVFGSPLWAM